MFRFKSARFVIPGIVLSVALAASVSADVSINQGVMTRPDGTSVRYFDIEAQQNGQPGVVVLVAGTKTTDIDLGLFRLEVMPTFVAPLGWVGRDGNPSIRVEIPDAVPAGVYAQAIAIFEDGSASATGAIRLGYSDEPQPNPDPNSGDHR